MHATEQLNTALAGRYVIDHLVGEGGMATVYLARDVKHNRKVALKVLKPDLGAIVGAAVRLFTGVSSFINPSRHQILRPHHARPTSATSGEAVAPPPSVVKIA